MYTLKKIVKSHIQPVLKFTLSQFLSLTIKIFLLHETQSTNGFIYFTCLSVLRYMQREWCNKSLFTLIWFQQLLTHSWSLSVSPKPRFHVILTSVFHCVYLHIFLKKINTNATIMKNGEFLNTFEYPTNVKIFLIVSQSFLL